MLITNSRIKSYLECPRQHHYRYNLGVRPIATSEALEFGSLLHAGLEAWWLAHKHRRPSEALPLARAAMLASTAQCESLDWVALTKADVLMIGYDARWSDAMTEWTVIAVEAAFQAPLLDSNGCPVSDLSRAGKIDAIAIGPDGRTWLVEHKTSGADLSPSSDYWSRLRLDSQISAYYAGAESLGHAIDGCLYDVIGKPTIRPHKATPDDKRKYTKTGSLYAGQRLEDETREEYAARLAEAITAEPELYYQRQDVIRLPSELEQSADDVLGVALLIRDSAVAPRNTDACHRWGRPCDYYDVCSGTADIGDPYRFRKLDNAHPELNPQPKEGTP